MDERKVIRDQFLWVIDLITRNNDDLVKSGWINYGRDLIEY
jgi:hypothetical protein